MANDMEIRVPERLTDELRGLIEASRQRVARTVNSELVLLYWQVGRRLRAEVVGEGRAHYGREAIAAVSRVLTAEFGRGFRKRNLHYMVRFAEIFPDPEIVHALRAQLGWTHFRQLIALDDPLQRQFYAELCRLERWSTRTLQAKIAGMLYERTAIARRPTEVIEAALEGLRDADRMSPDLVFRDPYVLDFLALPVGHGERQLEEAILRDLEGFLTELGEGFSFVARQKRISIGPDDYYLDLLFFHRPLKALLAIELKLGRFDARDKGQMELYLRWLDRHERGADENPPLGLILCADKNEEQIELLELDRGTVRVANYLTELPPRELLERRLARAIARARERAAEGYVLPGKISDGKSPIYVAARPRMSRGVPETSGRRKPPNHPVDLIRFRGQFSCSQRRAP